MEGELGPLHDQLDYRVSHLSKALDDNSLNSLLQQAEHHAGQLNESSAILDRYTHIQSPVSWKPLEMYLNTIVHAYIHSSNPIAFSSLLLFHFFSLAIPLLSSSLPPLLPRHPSPLFLSPLCFSPPLSSQHPG